MKNHILKIIFIITAFYLISCQIWEPNKLDFTYPLDAGRSWTYEKSGIIWGEDTDTLKYPFKDTVITSIIIGSVMSKDSTNLIAIQVGARVEYFENRDTGLFKIADNSIHYNSLVMPKKTHNKQIIINKNTLFNTLVLSSDKMLIIPSVSMNGVDSIFYNEPPIRIYQYPLKNATQWCYNDLGQLEIYREIIGTTEIEVEAGIFSCYHIRTYYDWSGDKIWDENMWMDDYVSKEGLIKRTFTGLNMSVIDSLGNILGTNSIATISLIDYTP
jgi:hypothetical protein